MSPWDRVVEELDIWARERRKARFWWRDDDAADVSPQLKRMVALAGSHGVAIGLSVIPMRLTTRLQNLVRAHGHLDVLVHGLTHTSHARPGQAKREFSGSVPREQMLANLARGLMLNQSAFGARCLPVLVPPWNRIPPGIVRDLPALGYQGISTWKPRASAVPVRGLLQINTHLDPVNWRAGRSIKPEALVASLVLRKLRWRRADPARAAEPLGLLTHHEHWCAEKEAIVVHLLKATRNHPAVSWLAPREVFSAP